MTAEQSSVAETRSRIASLTAAVRPQIPPSSSVIVSVTSAGPETPCELVAVPPTETVLSGAPTSLSTAVIVTVPVLVVAPWAIASVVLVLSV